MPRGPVLLLGLRQGDGNKPPSQGQSPAKLPFQMLGRSLEKFVNPDPNLFQGLRPEHFQPHREFLWAAGTGTALVLLCYGLRLKYSWWPIHPILFAIIGTFPSAHFAASFFLGWLINAAVMHFGGGKAYRASKPIFIGR